jgi:hypothetical protein
MRLVRSIDLPQHPRSTRHVRFPDRSSARQSDQLKERPARASSWSPPGSDLTGWMLVMTVLLVFIGLPMFFFGLAVMQTQER